MADPTLTTEVLDQPKLFNYTRDVLGELANINAYAQGRGTLQEEANNVLLNPGIRNQAQQYSNWGYGNLTPNQLAAKIKSDPAFADQVSKAGANFGQALSYNDYVKQQLATDPNFDPTDTQALNKITSGLVARGVFDKANGDVRNIDTEGVKTYLTSASVASQIDKAVNPGKYITDTQKADNVNQASTILKNVYGEDYQDTHGLTQFLADRIAGGETPYELSQFLQTTPEYMQKQSDIQAQKASTEAAAQREALNQELVKTQNDVFARAQPDIIASYMRAGRLNSSGLNSALAKAQQQLESERQGFLANAAYTTAQQQAGYNREDFVNAQNQAFNQYLQQNNPAQQQRLNLQNISNQVNYQQPYSNLSRFQQLSDAATQRQYQLQDYAMQQNDFYNALSQQRKMQNQAAMYGLLGNVVGAGATAGFGKLFG